MSNRFGQSCLVALTVIAVGCGPSIQEQMDTYKDTIVSGIRTLPWPLQMERLFGNGDHIITHYNMSPGPKTWNSEVFFGGKYELTLQVDVEIDYAKGKVSRIVGKPRFYLAEIESISIAKSGRSASARYSHDWNFGESDWIKLVTSKGDWKTIGIDVVTNSPVANFDFFVRQVRQPRIQVLER